MNNATYTLWCALVLMGIVIAPQLRGAEKPEQPPRKARPSLKISTEVLQRKEDVENEENAFCQRMIASREKFAILLRRANKAAKRPRSGEKIRERRKAIIKRLSNGRDESPHFETTREETLKYILTTIVGLTPKQFYKAISFAIGFETLKEVRSASNENIAQALDACEIRMAQSVHPNRSAFSILNANAIKALGLIEKFHENESKSSCS